MFKRNLTEMVFYDMVHMDLTMNNLIAIYLIIWENKSKL